MLHVCALLSGGKDSVYAVQRSRALGHDVVCAAHVLGAGSTPLVDAGESYLFQLQAGNAVRGVAECLGLPLVQRERRGRALDTSLEFGAGAPRDGGGGADEVDDLRELLREVRARYPHVTAVCSGAVLSTYQRMRVERVCAELGLISVAWLWHRDQRELLDEMVSGGMQAVLVKVAAQGLDASHLGRTVGELRDVLFELSARYGLHPCGEGGEYETLVVDCAAYATRRIQLKRASKTPLAGGGGAVLTIEDYEVVAKAQPPPKSPPPPAPPPLRPRPSPRADPPQRRSVVRLLPPSDGADASSAWFAGPFTLADASYADAFRGALAELTRAAGERPLERTAFVHLFLRDLDDFAAMNAAYESTLLAGCAAAVPARATVELPALEARAAVCFTLVGAPAARRRVLHVRSRSEWAPQCIGPYAQCNVVELAAAGERVLQEDEGATPPEPREVAFVAGQIAFDPATMALPAAWSREEEGDAALDAEVALAARNAARIARDETLVRMRKDSPACASAVLYASSAWVRTERQRRRVADAARAALELHGVGVAADRVALVVVPRLPREAAVEVELVVASAARGCGVAAVSAECPPPSPARGGRVLLFRGPDARQDDDDDVVRARRGWAGARVPVEAAFVLDADGAPRRCASVGVWVVLDPTPPAQG